MRGAFLKVADGEVTVVVSILAWVITNMIHQVNGYITAIIRYRFAVEQIQHSFKIGKLIPLVSPRQAKTPAVMSHQIVDDDLLA